MNKLMAWILCCCLVAASSAFAAEYIIDVPEGQVVSNTTDNIQAATAGDVLVKTGKGTYYTNKKIGDQVNFSRMEVREGTVEMASATSYFHPPVLEICAGAKVVQLNAASYNGNGVTIQIEEGGEWDAHYAGAAPDAFTGEGRITNCGGKNIFTADRLLNFKGSLEIDSPNITGSNLNIYDGAVHKLSECIGGFREIRGLMTGSRIDWHASEPLDVTCPLRGILRFYSSASNMTYSAYFADSLNLSVDHDVTFSGGLGHIQSQSGIGFGAGRTLTIAGGVVAGPNLASPAASTDSVFANADTRSRVLRWAPIYTGNPSAKFVMTSGEFYCGNNLPLTAEFNGGRFWMVGGGVYANKTYDQFDIVANGGRWCSWTDGKPAPFARTDSPLTFRVGPGGFALEWIGCKSVPSQAFAGYLTSNVQGGGKDGGVKTLGRGGFVFYHPLSITGPFETSAQGLGFNVTDATMKGAEHLLGTGDFRLGSTLVDSTALNGSVLALASGPGARLVAFGGGHVFFDEKQDVTVKIGPAGGAGSPLAREHGGVLFLGQGSYALLNGSRNRILVNGTVPLNGAGLPATPVVQATWGQHTSYTFAVDFMKYDETLGFVGTCESATTNDLTVSTSGVAAVNDWNRSQVSSDVSVGALRLDNLFGQKSDGYHSGLNGGNPDDAIATVTIAEGKTLTVGDGTNPAMVLINDNQYRNADFVSSIKGAGTLNFGGSEGLIIRNGAPALIMTPIDGQNGVSFVSFYKADRSEVVLTSPNKYKGETCINATTVTLTRQADLSTGDVRIDSGHFGGRLVFDRPMTFTNKLTVAGFGAGGTDVSGALCFKSNVVVTGMVDIHGATAFSAPTKGTEGVFENVITGDEELWILNDKANVSEGGVDTAFARDEAGTVVFTRNNALSQRIRIVRSNLCLRGADASLGSGVVELDSGRLRFENTAPVAFSNIVYGSGVIQLAAKNQCVTFGDNLLGQADERFTLDLASRCNTVSSLKGFSAVTTAKTGTVHLSVLDDAEGSFAGEVAENVVLHYGKVYAPGLTLIVR